MKNVPPAFDYSVDVVDTDKLEVVHALKTFLAERIVGRRNGRLPPPKTIAIRLITVILLLDPNDTRSLRSYARELDCSPAWMSKIALIFADQLGLTRSWQRINAREICSLRARGVHEGTWTPTPKWERRKLRQNKIAETALTAPAIAHEKTGGTA